MSSIHSFPCHNIEQLALKYILLIRENFHSKLNKFIEEKFHCIDFGIHLFHLIFSMLSNKVMDYKTKRLVFLFTIKYKSL